MTMDSDERLTGIYDEEGCILTYVSLEVNADTALELGMKSGQEMEEIEAQTRTVPEAKASPVGSVTVQKVQLSLNNGGAVYNELFMQSLWKAKTMSHFSRVHPTGSTATGCW